MHPRPPGDPLRGPSQRVRSPRRGASKVDVMLGPERPRLIVTPLLRADVARLNVLGSMAACCLAPSRCESSQSLGSCTLGSRRDLAAAHAVSWS